MVVHNPAVPPFAPPTQSSFLSPPPVTNGLSLSDSDTGGPTEIRILSEQLTKRDAFLSSCEDTPPSMGRGKALGEWLEVMSKDIRSYTHRQTQTEGGLRRCQACQCPPAHGEDINQRWCWTLDTYLVLCLASVAVVRLRQPGDAVAAAGVVSARSLTSLKIDYSYVISAESLDLKSRHMDRSLEQTQWNDGAYS